MPAALAGILFRVFRSKGQVPRFFVNVPIPLAAALNLQGGEQLPWQLLGVPTYARTVWPRPPPSPEPENAEEGFSAESN